MEKTNCPKCNSPLDKDLHRLYDKDVGLLYKCPKCGFVFYEKTITIGRKKLISF